MDMRDTEKPKASAAMKHNGLNWSVKLTSSPWQPEMTQPPVIWFKTKGGKKKKFRLC